MKLDTGATYAVQVVARDLSRQVAFQNNGRSEVVTFLYGKKRVIQNVIIKPIEKKKPGGTGFSVTNTDPVPYSQVKGKLYYKFKDADNNKNVKKQTQQKT